MKNGIYANFLDFANHFTDNDLCRQHLEKLRWNGKPRCPKCGYDQYYAFQDGKTYKCKRKECQRKYNVFVGSAFENTKIPLNKWFWAVYVATSHKKGISSAQLGRDIDVTQKTAWFMLHRLRNMLAPENGKFTKIVEIDEAYIGGKNRNKHAKKRNISPAAYGRASYQSSGERHR